VVRSIQCSRHILQHFFDAGEEEKRTTEGVALDWKRVKILSSMKIKFNAHENLF
jgi:hypothetical protein